MAIAQDWYVDYYNKVICHSSFWVYYTGLSGGPFTAGETITFDALGSNNGPYTAVCVYDNGTDRMNIVYLEGDESTFTATDTMAGGSSSASAAVGSWNTHSYGMTKWIITHTGKSGSLSTGEATIGTDDCYIDYVDNTNDVIHVSYFEGTSDPSGTITDSGTETATVSTAYEYKSTVTTRALYSHLQDTFDELVQLDDTVPMSAQTPTEFTLINGWFIDDESVKYLEGGALSTSGYEDEIRVLYYGTETAAAINSDIGKQVLAGTTADTGTLLHHNSTQKQWWIRMDDSDDLFDDAAETYIVQNSGTGSVTSNAVSATGEDTYTNIYTLGTIATDPKPETYIFQNSTKITSWWGRGNTTSHIDALIKVYEMDDGSTDSGIIGDGTITVFVRNYADLYDHFNISLTTGGRKAVPLASASDLNNNTTGEGYLLYDNETTAFTVGLIITGGTSSATAEVLAITDWGSEGVLTLGHIKGVFQDNEEITDTGSGQADVNGVIGYSYLTYSGETGGGFTTSDTVTGATSGATGTLVGLQDDGTTGKLVILPTNYSDYSLAENLQVSSTTRGVAATAATRSVVAYDDIDIWFVNLSIPTGAISAAYTEGENVTTTAGTGTGDATFLHTSATTGAGGTMHVGNVTSTANANFDNGDTITGGTSGSTCTASGDAVSDYQLDKNFTQGSSNPYSVIIDCSGRYMSEVYEWLKYVTRENANQVDQINAVSMYPVVSGAVVTEDGEEYISAQTSYTAVKASPFGTFAGGKFFAARGVWVQNMHTDDIQAFQLIDSSGATQTPPNFQSITISNLVSSDRVLVARTSSGSTINKAVFSMSAQASAQGTITIDDPSGGIPSDTPDSGYIRVVDVSDTSINREQRYAYTSWTGSVFTLSGTTTRAYTTDDTAYVPYIDATATTTSESVTVIYSSDRTVVARIRRYNGTTDSILPFETTGTFGSTGYSAVTIRTPDTIVT